MRRKYDIFFFVALISLSFLFSGCVSQGSQADASAIAAQAGLTSEKIATPAFLIAAWHRETSPVATLNVYIEGDGFAWKSRTQPSDNPTPRNPVGLMLAAADTRSNVLYLARPCQFITPLPANCRASVWTSERFSPAQVDAINAALDQFVLRYPGVTLNLVGYSGGGNIAALLAARRTDVHSLRTVAGNLDVVYVNALHHVSAMPNALNAIDYVPQLRGLPQVHFSGEVDSTVPPEVARRFEREVSGECTKVEVVKGMAHGSDWGAVWPQLLKEECRDAGIPPV